MRGWDETSRGNGKRRVREKVGIMMVNSTITGERSEGMGRQEV